MRRHGIDVLDPAASAAGPCSSTARSSAPCAGPTISADFQALVIDYIDQLMAQAPKRGRL